MIGEEEKVAIVKWGIEAVHEMNKKPGSNGYMEARKETVFSLLNTMGLSQAFLHSAYRMGYYWGYFTAEERKINGNRSETILILVEDRFRDYPLEVKLDLPLDISGVNMFDVSTNGIENYFSGNGKGERRPLMMPTRERVRGRQHKKTDRKSVV